MAFGAVLPEPLGHIVDLAFIPGLAIAVAIVLWPSKARRNLMFVPILLVLWVADLLLHLEITEILADSAAQGLSLAVDAVVLLMVILGGRITPSFTRNTLKAEGIEAPVRSWKIVEILSVISVLAVLIADLIAPENVVLPWLAGFAALLQFVRLAGWQTARTVNQPILWVLHVGYLWIAVGLALRAATGISDLVPPSAAMHALTAGAIGTYTLGMMSRVALGHTARPLIVRPAIAASYGLISVAALVRIAAPVVAPDLYIEAMMVAAGLWIVAFSTFSAVYWPILTGPRADGKPG